MKKLHTYLLGLMLIGFAFQSTAQTSINIAFAGVDSTRTSFCLPDDSANFWVSVSLSGYTLPDSIDLFVNYGDGTIDTSRLEISSSGGSQWAFYGNGHTYTGVGTYIVQTIAVASDGKRDTLLASPIDVLSCGNLSGKVYFDKNANCIFDTGDEAFTNAHVKVTDPVTSNTYFVNTDVNGDYDIKVPIGPSYDVTMWSSYYTISCPVGGHTGVTVPSTGIDLGLDCPAGFDLFGNITGAGFRPGFPRFFNARPFNVACTPTNGTIKVVLSDPRISYYPSTFIGTPPAVNGDTLSWNFTGLTFSSGTGSIAGTYFPFYVLTDTSVSLTDTICMEVIVEPTTGDLDPSNNSEIICFPVNNSYDPNEKTAQPLGVNENHIVSPETQFEYTIHFQNTGNDVAYKVYILDELDANLDLSTIEIHGSTHPMKFDVINERTLRFTFDNINLPDSASDPVGSQGSVTFTVDHVPGIALGTQIENQVGIYFDFNEPIITNKVVRTVDVLSSISELPVAERIAQVYPNPAQDVLIVQLNNSETADIHLRGITGKTIWNRSVSNGKAVVSVSDLPAGVYLLEINTNETRQVERLIVK
jgi:fimbrial isopeptide formation D2 family protein